jgi:8-amino-3,8-dideoxy-alpha-D-manno-octulosonate transaminase
MPAAVLLAQLRKLPGILAHLRRNKRRYQELIADLPGIEFREVIDLDGECATILTVILPTAEVAEKIAADLGTKVIGEAGWHVYNNMEHILAQRTVTPDGCSFTCPIYASRGGHIRYSKGMLPRTDALVARSLNISIGVSDPGLSSSFGVTIKDGLDVVEQRAGLFRSVAEKYLH